MRKQFFNPKKIYENDKEEKKYNFSLVDKNSNNFDYIKNKSDKINLKDLSQDFKINELKTKTDVRLPFEEIKQKENNFPNLNYKNEYNQLINKFNNFNLINFLKEGKKDLVINIKKIEKKETIQNPIIQQNNNNSSLQNISLNDMQEINSNENNKDIIKQLEKKSNKSSNFIRPNSSKKN